MLDVSVTYESDVEKALSLLAEEVAALAFLPDDVACGRIKQIEGDCVDLFGKGVGIRHVHVENETRLVVGITVSFFVIHDSVAAAERQCGKQDCGNSQNCKQVCPKHINLTAHIAAMNRAANAYVLRSFLDK